jgi:hypothetical protein
MPPNRCLFAPNVPVTRDALLAALRSPAAGLTAAQAGKLVSYAGRALAAAGYPAGSPADLRLVLANLDRLATTRALHADAPGACRQVRALATGATGAERLMLPADRTLLPETFEALLAYAPDAKRARARSRLTTLARVISHLGLLASAPAAMPGSAAMRAAAPAVGIRPDTVDSALAPYRRLRDAALAADPANARRFGPIPDGRRVRGRSVLAVLAARGDLGEAADPLAAIGTLAPMLHKQLVKYMAAPVVRDRVHVAGTVAANVEAAARLVGDLAIHAPEVLPAFKIGDLWSFCGRTPQRSTKRSRSGTGTRPTRPRRLRSRSRAGSSTAWCPPSARGTRRVRPTAIPR